MAKDNSLKLPIVLNPLHDNFENFVELVGAEAFDVFGVGIEVAPDVGENGEMGVDGNGLPLEDFKIGLAGR